MKTRVLLRRQELDDTLTRVYENRFIPNRGVVPAYFEGREDICKRLHMYIRSTIDGSPPRKIPVILGPIGIGKTAVLRWIESHAKDEILVDESLKVIFSSGSMLQSSEDARKLLGGEINGKIWKQIWSDVEEKSKVNLLAERRDWEKGQYAPNVGSAIDIQYKKTTSIVIVDDAQLIERDAFIALTREITRLSRNKEAAILLILGGRQGVLDLLSYVEKLHESKMFSTDIMRLRPLKFAEVCKVLRSTLELGEIPIQDEAIIDVAEATGGHPLFVQCWGNILWNETRWHHRDRVAKENIDEAQQILDYKLGKDPGFRRRDWNNDELEIVYEVWKALQDKEKLTYKELYKIAVKTGETSELDDFQSIEILEKIINEDIVDRDSVDSGYKEAIPMRIEYFLRDRNKKDMSIQ